jgi:hypothetical protein
MILELAKIENIKGKCKNLEILSTSEKFNMSSLGCTKLIELETTSLSAVRDGFNAKVA